MPNIVEIPMPANGEPLTRYFINNQWVRNIQVHAGAYDSHPHLVIGGERLELVEGALIVGGRDGVYVLMPPEGNDTWALTFVQDVPQWTDISAGALTRAAVLWGI